MMKMTLHNAPVILITYPWLTYSAAQFALTFLIQKRLTKVTAV